MVLYLIFKAARSEFSIDCRHKDYVPLCKRMVVAFTHQISHINSHVPQQ